MEEAAHTSAKIPLDHCSACAGYWFDWGELDEYVKVEGPGPRRIRLPGLGGGQIALRQRGFSCPRCTDQKLRSFAWKGFVFDRCRGCKGFFLEENGAQALVTEEWHRHLPEPPDPRSLEPYTVASLLTHLGFGALMALAFTLIAFVGIVGRVLVVGATISVSLTEILMTAAAFIVIVAAYLCSGLVGGFVVWLLHPLRRWMFGWLITGFVVMTAVYGIVGLSSVIAYTGLGINIMGFKSAADAWDTLPYVTLIAGSVVGLTLGFFFHQERDWE